MKIAQPLRTLINILCYKHKKIFLLAHSPKKDNNNTCMRLIKSHSIRNKIQFYKYYSHVKCGVIIKQKVKGLFCERVLHIKGDQNVNIFLSGISLGQFRAQFMKES